MSNDPTPTGWEQAARAYPVTTELGRLRMENEGLRKANALLMASMQSQSALYDDLKQANRTMGAENARLRNLCLQLEIARDERDALLTDLREIGRMLGCDHIHDGLARCVRDLLQRVEALKGGGS